MRLLPPSLAKIVFGYGTGALIQGLVAFLAVPMLIRALGADSFAIWAIAEPVIGLAALTALLGASHGHLRSLALRETVASQVFRLQLRYGAVPAVLVAALAAAAVVYYLKMPEPWILWTLVTLYVCCETIIALTQAVYRGVENAVGYATTNWVKFGLLGLGLASCTWLGLRFSLIQYLQGLIALDVLVIVTVVLRYRYSARPAELPVAHAGAEVFRAAVRYGLPIQISSALVVVASNGDRYVVQALMPAGQLAGYVTMAKLAGALSFSAAPIALWWPAARFRHAADADGGAGFYNAATTVLLFYYLTVSAMVWLAAPIVIGHYAPGVGAYDSTTMLILLCAATASAMVTPMNVGTLNQGKTHWIIWTIGSSAALGILIAALLLPRIGYAGAAVGAIVSQVTALAATHIASQRIQFIRFEYRKPLLLLAGFGLAVMLVVELDRQLLPSLAVMAAYFVTAAFIAASDIRKMLE